MCEAGGGQDAACWPSWAQLLLQLGAPINSVTSIEAGNATQSCGVGPGQDQHPLPTLTPALAPALAQWHPQHHLVFPCLIAFDLAVARETKSCSLGSICILISNYQQCCSSPAAACKVPAATWGCPAGVARDALSLPALPSSLCQQASRGFGIDGSQSGRVTC